MQFIIIIAEMVGNSAFQLPDNKLIKHVLRSNFSL